MLNKAFTNKLYNPKSMEFKNMENYVCNMVSTPLAGFWQHTVKTI